MGNSFSVYEQKGFWAHDTEIQFFLKLAVDIMGPNAVLCPELAKLQETWKSVSDEGPTGSLDLQLDDFITNEFLKDRLLQVIEKVMQELSHRGDVITRSELTTVFGEPFRGDLRVSRVQGVGEALRALLRREQRSIPPQIVSRDDPNWRGEKVPPNPGNRPGSIPDP